MSGAKVDVLAVMKRDRDAADNFRCQGDQLAAIGAEEYMAIREEVAEAHAAVAELIRSADTLATAVSNLIAARQVPDGYRQYVTDVTAALAGVSP